ncbi:helix-turn-helix domain-containing protein [Paenibacillus shenyangensis]|uniref:helix-turn-helix domain-containing protein n=1 Tax=Paenibacillus sp. A9 TaxID=1284352 RepID=UPI00036A4408|nr:helix-turn-helix transcriptional regulator [Paenibacillus sp. A9]
MDNLNAYIGEKVKYHRKALNMSTTTLGKLSDTSQSTISQIENGRATSVENLLKICTVLKISFSDVLPPEIIPSYADHGSQLLGIIESLTDSEVSFLQLLLSSNIIPTLKSITPLIDSLDKLDDQTKNNFLALINSFANNRNN